MSFVERYRRVAGMLAGGEVHVQQHHIERRGRQGRLDGIGGRDQLHPLRRARQRQTRGLQHVGVVVEHQDEAEFAHRRQG